MAPYSIVKTPLTINAISNNFVSRKNYYSKPSFPDVQLEERNYQLVASYDGSSFYEWNIDGMSEHQIINLLHEMMMAVSAYRIKTSNSDFHVEYFFIPKIFISLLFWSTKSSKLVSIFYKGFLFF